MRISLFFLQAPPTTSLKLSALFYSALFPSYSGREKLKTVSEAKKSWHLDPHPWKHPPNREQFTSWYKIKFSTLWTKSLDQLSHPKRNHYIHGSPKQTVISDFRSLLICSITSFYDLKLINLEKNSWGTMIQIYLY